MPDAKYHTPRIAWIDLTVSNAADVRDFYTELLGFHSEPVEMGAKILDGPRDGFCVFQDPGGAVSALYQAPEENE